MAYPEFTTEELESEEWREILGYEGIYSVSNLGRIRREKQSCGTQSGRIIGGFLDSDGYAIAGLQRRPRKIHQLVAEAFIGPRPPNMTVNHKDGVKINNRPTNLEYLTGYENRMHAKAMGLMPRGDRSGLRKHPEKCRRGEANHNTTLTTREIQEIRARYRSGHETIYTLARTFNVSKSTIANIINRKTWAHV